MGIIEGRYCKKCDRFYDIGANLETCPDCRYKEMRENQKKREENGK